MSEVVVIGAYNATIYGTLAAATAHMNTRLGTPYAAWIALSPDDQKRALASAADYLNRQVWNEEADTFAERDAIAAFQLASYELAAMVAEDDTIITQLDQGTNIAEAGAGGAYVKFANPTSARRGTAPVLPPILQLLIGSYLVVSEAISSSDGATGGCRNPLSGCSDYDRKEPY